MLKNGRKMGCEWKCKSITIKEGYIDQETQRYAVTEIEKEKTKIERAVKFVERIYQRN